MDDRGAIPTRPNALQHAPLPTAPGVTPTALGAGGLSWVGRVGQSVCRLAWVKNPAPYPQALQPLSPPKIHFVTVYRQTMETIS